MDISRGDKIVFKKLEDIPPNVLGGSLLRYAQIASGMVMTVQSHTKSIFGLGFRYVYLTDDTGTLFSLQVCDDMIDHIVRYQENVQYEDSEDLSDFLGSFEVVP